MRLRSTRRASEAPWDLRRVVHLHRRAGFAAPWEVLQRDLKDGPEPSIARLLNGDPHARQTPERFEATASALAESAEIERSPLRLKAWWTYRMAFSPDPLGERLALLWHNQFATSNLKVDDPGVMRRQKDLFRSLGRAPFGTLLSAVLHDPAVLIWLDAPENRKDRPNENLARELMELFTLGVGHYSELDVKEAARALSGWTVVAGEFRSSAEDHDTGAKSLLGRSGTFTGDDLLMLLLDQPATADRLAWRICDMFLGEGVASEAERAALASGLRDRNLDLRWAVETVLRSATFFRDDNLRSKVLGPVDLVIGAIRALELPPSAVNPEAMASWMAAMGQDLFYPPNVGGWTGGRAWLSAREAIGRINFARSLASGDLSVPAAAPEIQALADRHGQSDPLFFLSGLLLGTPPPPTWRAWDTEPGPDRAGAARRILARALAAPESQLA
jgi:uncharacterized protein (DUF1800 family)